MTFLSEDLRVRGADERSIRFREWRRRIRLTLRDAAGLLAITEKHLTRVECGGARLTDQLANAMSVLASGWSESQRPARGPERRGGWNRGRRRDSSVEALR